MRFGKRIHLTGTTCSTKRCLLNATTIVRFIIACHEFFDIGVGVGSGIQKAGIKDDSDTEADSEPEMVQLSSM